MHLDALAFGAHVDDIELGCGATIAKLTAQGHAIGACELTAGELSTRGTVDERTAEAQEAAQILGLKTRINLGIPDGNIEENQANKLKVIRVLRQYRPKYVFVNYWQCRHYDHIHTSNVVSEACFYSGLKKIDTAQEPFRPNIVMYYFLRHEGNPSFVVDVTGFHEIKMRAILAHKSQFHNPEVAEPDTFISSRYFIDSILKRMQGHGLRIGAEYGEAFAVRETLKIDDPFAFFNAMDANRILVTRGGR